MTLDGEIIEHSAQMTTTDQDCALKDHMKELAEKYYSYHQELCLQVVSPFAPEVKPTLQTLINHK